MKLRILASIVLFSAVQSFCGGQIPKEGYLSDFETIWKKVNETYFDPSFGGGIGPRPMTATSRR